MSQSVKLKDGSYIDASGVWDNTQGKTQEAFNSGVQHILHAVATFTTSARGEITLPVYTSIAAWSASLDYVLLREYAGVWSVRNRTTLAPITATSIKVDYLYVDKITWTTG